VLHRLEQELKLLPTEKQSVERRRSVEAWIDAGHGSCVLQKPEVARMAEETLLFFDGDRYRLLSWVVMPNHVHVLFQPIGGWSMAKIVESWKKHTAKRINDYRRSTEGKSLGATQESGGPRADVATQESGGPRAERIWHREYWDRFIRDDNHLYHVIDYIQQNPVKAGLARLAEDWPWGSARFNVPEQPSG
jgi:REP element-mobilizing transposase RayT